MSRYFTDRLALARRRRRRGRQARAFTLVELLVTMVVTLILIGALAQAFAIVGESLSQGRAVMELSGSLRFVANRLQKDLDGITVAVTPWTDEGTGAGYFEIVDGPSTDNEPVITPAIPTMFGDIDDVIAFTAFSDGTPFLGVVNGNMRESAYAEIVWSVHLDDRNGNGVRDDGEFFLVSRRVLLILPEMGSLVSENLADFWEKNDLSVRFEGSEIKANSLADLTKRENRFARNAKSPFPHPLNTDLTVRTGPKAADDLMLSNVLAFDVRVFDPDAPIYKISDDSNEALIPGDPGYVSAASSAASDPSLYLGKGAFVDLGYVHRVSGAPAGLRFSDFPKSKSQLQTYTYCTWTMYYERDGLDQDENKPVDQGTNGIDDDGVNGVDDVGERETSPPYPLPLRGIQVKIRAWDPDSRQVRQVSVVSNFVPE